MIKKLILSLFVALSVPALIVSAAVPTFTASGSGDGNGVLVNVSNAEANMPVTLYYTGSADGATHSYVVGTTNSSGMFSGTVNTNSIGINSSTPLYVLVNGYQSNSISWPSSNGTMSPITFSSTNPSLTVGQTGTLTVSGGSGSYYVYGNTNNGIITPTISGNTLSYYGAGSGSSVVTVCSTNVNNNNSNNCGTVTINSANMGTTSTNNNSVMFSSSNPNVMMGQNGTLTLSGGSGSYYISNNSNTGIITPTISGNTLSYYGNGSGSSVVTVCSTYGNDCRTVTINSSMNGTVNNIMMSPSMTNLTIGQSGTVQLSGGTGPYTIYPTNGSSVSTYLSGNTLTLNGAATGNTSFNVCDVNNMCSPYTVMVTSNQTTTSTTMGMNYTIGLAVNEVVKLTMNTSGSYYLQSTMTSPIMTSLSGNILTVMGVSFGSATVNVCQTGMTTCTPIMFVVDRAAPTAGSPSTGTGGSYTFSDDMWEGVTSDGIIQLQTALIADGYMTGTPTGYFGPITKDAVMKFQTANGISSTGYVGTLTRAALNRY